MQRIVKCRPYIKRVATTRLQPTMWTVPALCAAYGWPKNLAGGGIIGIVELGGGWVKSDLQRFFGLNHPLPTVIDVSVDGTQNSQQNPPTDADYEVALDIQVACAAYFAATGKPATIRVYWSQDIASAVALAAKDGCAVCSISWGADEADWSIQGCQQMELAAQAATALGMTVFAATGDNDSSDGGPSAANVDCPGSCPHVISCGGTRKTFSRETVWNDNPGETNGEGTGGGYSTVFPVQSFQLRVPKAPLGLGRMVPDVCANADPVTGYEITVYGQTQIVGGTSAVAPLFAGLFAAIGKKLGFVSPTLWEHQSDFNDIVQGNNGQYSAGVGPDACSGLGSPKAAQIAALFAK